MIGDRLLLTLRRGGEPLLAITDLAGGQVIRDPPGVAAGSISVEHAEDYDAGSVIVMEESLIEPPAWYRLDLATGERSLLKRRRCRATSRAGTGPSGSARGRRTAQRSR